MDDELRGHSGELFKPRTLYSLHRMVPIRTLVHRRNIHGNIRTQMRMPVHSRISECTGQNTSWVMRVSRTNSVPRTEIRQNAYLSVKTFSSINFASPARSWIYSTMTKCSPSLAQGSPYFFCRFPTFRHRTVERLCRRNRLQASQRISPNGVVALQGKPYKLSMVVPSLITTTSPCCCI